MNQCPECHSLEVDAAGTCMVCGHKADPQDHESRQNHEAVKETGGDSASVVAPVDAAELPDWRLELSRRLQEIKQRRIGSEQAPEGVQHSVDSGVRISSGGSPPGGKPTQEGPAGKRRRKVQPGRAQSASISDTQTNDDVKSSTPADDHRPAPKEPVIQAEAAPATEKQELEEIIDRAVSRSVSPKGSGPAQLPLDYYNPAPKWREDHGEDRLMLLTRTLSGLVDLVLIAAFSSAFVFAVDIIEGITVFDRVSLLHYVLLLILTFLVYSTYFLATATQTVGMMITDLRVVGRGSRRPRTIQILIRCSAYLFSLLFFGIGLLWGCIDGKSRCLHDRLSDTRVVRI